MPVVPMQFVISLPPVEVHGRSRSSTPGPKMASVDANDLPSAVEAVKVIGLASFISA
jgi:hypothetical protein